MSVGEDCVPSIETLPAFYPPNAVKEEFEITNREYEQIKEALKKEEFRKLLVEYVEDVQNPDSVKTYQSEVRQLERDNGNVVHFLNPIPGYVLKTSVDGRKKGFVNVCCNPLIRRPTIQKADSKGSKNGVLWSIPYAQSPAKQDVDKAGTLCQVYDVIFHPEALQLGNQFEHFRQKLEQIALDGVENSFKVSLDRNNVKKPKVQYKGAPRATVIKYKIGEAPPTIIDPDAIENEIPPQPIRTPSGDKQNETGFPPRKIVPNPLSKTERKLRLSDAGDAGEDQNHEWTSPRYSIKYRSHVELQDCCIDNQRTGFSSKPIPDEVILTVDLPLLRDSSTLEADVLEDGWNFELNSNRKAYYKLRLKLPHQVHPDSAKAKFDKDHRKLHITMRAVQAKKCVKDVMRQPSDEIEVFDSDSGSGDEAAGVNSSKKLVEEIDEGKTKEPDVGYESTESNEHIPTVINGNVVVKSILKGSANKAQNRCRSLSESWIEHMDHLHKDQFESLESLSESNELLFGEDSSSPPREKSVRFSDSVQRQMYRSNSSILGQRKKNQRKNKNKRKNRERHNSEGSASSFEDDTEGTETAMEPLNSSAGPSAAIPIRKPKKQRPCKSMSLE